MSLMHQYNKLDVEQQMQMLDVAANSVFRHLLLNQIQSIERELILFEVDNADVEISLRYHAALKSQYLVYTNISELMSRILMQQLAQNQQVTQKEK